jgi:hypothetical protein
MGNNKNGGGKGMNYKEALTEIKYQLEDVGDYDDVYWDCVPTAILNVCAEALEKQIPKQVKAVTVQGKTRNYIRIYCPVCGGSIWKNTDESKYCFRCGQKLDWEVSE